jgi:MFS family permease
MIKPLLFSNGFQFLQRNLQGDIMGKKINTSTLAIMTVFFIAAGGSAVNPVIQHIIRDFPNVSVALIRLVSTLPSFSAMFVTLGFGAIIGKKIKYKTVSLIGIVCYVLGGVGPAFFNSNIYIILFFRAIFGIAIGCLACRNAYLLTTVEKARQARWIGNGQVVQNAGAAILQFVAGVLADINWRYAFYPYFVAIIAFFIVATMMTEPEITGAPAGVAAGTAGPAPKGRLGTHFIIYIVIQFCTMIHAMPVLTGMSTLVIARGLGNATTTGTILAICQIGGLITGVIFGKFSEILKRFTMPASLFVQGLGIFLILIGGNVVLIGLGSVLSGIGTILIISINLTWTGQSVSKTSIAFGTAIVTTLGQIGSFISPYWINATSAIFKNYYQFDVERVYLMGSIVFAILIVLTCIFDVSSKPLQLETVEEKAAV